MMHISANDHRHAFVMPLVLLLTIIIALGLALAVERNAAKSRNVNRQLLAYREHHAAKGIQEAISAWLGQQNARTINDALGEGGHALDLELPDRTTLKVFMRDGQGTILDPTAAGPNAYNDAYAISERLKLLCKEAHEPYDPLQRPLGPSEISVNAAERLVLQAVAEHILGLDQGAAFVNKIVDIRADKGELARSDILTAASELGLDNQLRNALASTLTATPEIWFVTVEMYGSRAISSKPLARYGGLVPLQAGNTRTGGAWEQPGVFLTWEDLGVEYRPDGDHRP